MKADDVKAGFAELKGLLDALLEQGKATRSAVKGLEARVVTLESRPSPRAQEHRTFTVTVDGDRPVRGIRVVYADEEDPK